MRFRPPALKPCPFCGSSAAFEEIEARSSSTGEVCFSVGCRNDQCIGFQSMATYPRRSDAMKAWNQRVS